MPKLKPVHLFIVIGLGWAVFSASLFFNRTPPPELFDAVHSAEFRMGLYNRGPESCIALASLDRLDVLVVGNSHVYSGIDADMVAQAFPRQRTGVCGLGTFRPERFADLFEYLDAHDLRPRRIILVVDPYFIANPISDQDGAEVRSVFFDNTVRGEFLSDWAAALDAGMPLLGESLGEIEARIAFHAEQLEALNLATVTQIIADHTLRHEAYSQGFISRLSLKHDLDAQLAALCDEMRDRRIRVDLLGIPDGPYELVEHDLDIGGVALSDAVDYFAEAFPCERRYVNRTVSGWGLDVRHRLNRSMEIEFDYTLFADADGFAERYQALPSNRARGTAYDTSHLNRVGTGLYTERAMQALND